MLNIITHLLDVLFPPREGELVVRALTSLRIPTFYQPGVHQSIEYLSHYQSPSVHALITENKYYANRQAATLLAQLLALYLKNSGSIVLLPIPLHPKRERERGYNQVTVVLQKSGHTVDKNIITRTKYTPSQTQLQKTERLKNIKDAFTVNEVHLHKFKDTHFILVDDVVTTGATMLAARAALAPHLDPTCTLTCLALAH
jgi:ComF family protein